MKIYNEDKTILLDDYDENLGYLKEDKLIIHHDKVETIEEEGHYEVIKEYPNGGKDVKWVVDKEGIEGHEAYDEEEEIRVYIPYSEEEKNKRLNNIKLFELKQELQSTDYEAIKYAEGWFTEEEYAPIKQHREELREKIRALID